MENISVEKELDWDGPIEKDSEFTLLPEGEYDFVVENFERGRFNGSEKMPACNMAIVKIRVLSNADSVLITHNFMLHTKTEWSLSSFFTAIGQKKKGEVLRMNWQLVPGARGRCKLGIKQYKENEYNEIKRFLAPEQKQSFTPGSF